MWGKILNAARLALSFLFTGIKWWSLAERVIEYYLILVELANAEKELNGEEKRQRVLDMAWDDLNKASWWPKSISRDTFDAVMGWVLDRLVGFLNTALGHNWRSKPDPEYLAALSKEVDDILK